MKMILPHRLMAAALFMLLSAWSFADELMMIRSEQTFPETMLKLQETINKMGYTISRVQRVDIGLSKSGYMTDKYRVVFFGRNNEITEITAKYPHLIPYIPWKIAIFAEQENTLLVTADPLRLLDKRYPGANRYLYQWKKDLEKIMHNMQKAE